MPAKQEMQKAPPESEESEAENSEVEDSAMSQGEEEVEVERDRDQTILDDLLTASTTIRSEPLVI